MVQRAALVAAFALGLARDCGGADNPPSGLYAPCTRTKDCDVGLVCTEGACQQPDAGQVLDSATGTPEPGDAADDGG
jgi:hypothetical protein